MDVLGRKQTKLEPMRGSAPVQEKYKKNLISFSENPVFQWLQGIFSRDKIKFWLLINICYVSKTAQALCWLTQHAPIVTILRVTDTTVRKMSIANPEIPGPGSPYHLCYSIISSQVMQGLVTNGPSGIEYLGADLYVRVCSYDWPSLRWLRGVAVEREAGGEEYCAGAKLL